ncbi:MAG: hypothetical protein V2A58_04280 [Planctomycetota bacterium]
MRRSWSLGQGSRAGHGWGANGRDETPILELTDGRLLGLMRPNGPGADGRTDPHTHDRFICRRYSEGGGANGRAQSIQAEDGTILTFYGTGKIGRVKPPSPSRWYPDDVHCYVGLSRYTEDYVRARGQGEAEGSQAIGCRL